MLTEVWNKCSASVCQLNFLNERGFIIDILTGFKVKDHLVTSHDAFSVEKAHCVEITFRNGKSNTTPKSKRIPYAEFNKEQRIGVLNNGHYAVYNIDFQKFRSVPSLELSEKDDFNIGSQIAFLGFCCNSPVPCLRTGYISSFCTNSDGVRFIQLDVHSNYGNSGAPLIDPKTLKVIGILSCRSTIASSAYKQLIDTMSFNLNELKKVKTSIKFGEIEPIQALIANQNQLKLLVNNIYKYSLSNHPQAVMLDKIISFFNQDLFGCSVNTCVAQE